MITSKRFNLAVQKLYSAFHNNTLNPEDCKHCAVGNILDNISQWEYLSEKHGTTRLSYIGMLNQKLGRRFNGYSPMELLQVETAFLKGCGYKFIKNNRLQKPKNFKDNDILFNGLSEVIAVLCRLDNIENVMAIDTIQNSISNQKSRKFKEKIYI
ncbi:Na(+)-translocating NADH-quinone reductase subunit F [Winogradskyella ursingii]|uniref:Na(+)-translocating NADH-quinone reductase subunit F n=1 Tax=Winogradskyella ursingii TaxID=2686079 RepID=UPI0015C96858|nr:Na(+)-translocating NADH-quinone reductase subunit F [Winogradskyella ursingii]